MSIVLTAVSILLGFISGTMIVIVMCCIHFGIPYTSKLQKLGILGNGGDVLKYYVKYILIMGAVIAFLTWCVHQWLSGHLLAYYSPLAVMSLLGLGKSGATDANLSNYHNNHKHLFDQGKMRQMGINPDSLG